MNQAWSQATALLPTLVQAIQGAPTVDGKPMSGAEKAAAVASAVLEQVPAVAPFMFLINLTISALVSLYKNKHPDFVPQPVVTIEKAAPAALPPSATNSFQAQQFGG